MSRSLPSSASTACLDKFRRPEVQGAITKPLQAAGALRCCAAGPRNVREPAVAVTKHFLSTPT